MDLIVREYQRDPDQLYCYDDYELFATSIRELADDTLAETLPVCAAVRSRLEGLR